MKKKSVEGRIDRRIRGKNLLTSLLCVLCSILLVPVSVYCADKLIVNNSTGGTGFVVTDDPRVGMNTANPQSSLHLVDTSTSPARGMITAEHSTPNVGALIVGRRSRGTEASPVAVTLGDFLGAFNTQGFDGSSYQAPTSLASVVDGAVSIGSIPASLVFNVGTATANKPERMRITSSGNVGIGTSTPTHLIQLSGGAFSDGTTWNNASSREYKENIRELTTEEAMNTLAGLNPVKYNYKTDKEDKHVGFIAEDVPDLVATKDRKGLSPMDIVAVLTKVMQEKSQVIERQQQTLEEQQNTIADMKEKLDKTARALATMEKRLASFESPTKTIALK